MIGGLDAGSSGGLQSVSGQNGQASRKIDGSDWYDFFFLRVFSYLGVAQRSVARDVSAAGRLELERRDDASLLQVIKQIGRERGRQ